MNPEEKRYFFGKMPMSMPMAAAQEGWPAQADSNVRCIQKFGFPGMGSRENVV